MKIRSRTNRIGLVLMFFLWPFFSLWFSVNNFRKTWARNLFWCFCIYFGFTFVLGKDIPGAADSVRYAQTLTQYASSEVSLKTFSSMLYSSESGYVDVVQPIVTFLVSRVTNNAQVLLAVFAAIFGFFYSRNIWYVLDRAEGRISILLGLFILVFVLFNPIWNINGFRMNTAIQIFFYGTLPVITGGNKKRIWWAFSSILVHFAFIYAVFILLIYLLLKDRLNIYFYFFIISVFITALNTELLKSGILLLPENFNIRLISYTNEEYALAITENIRALNWYVPYSGKVITWLVYAFAIYFFTKGRRIIKDNETFKKLFSFSLLFYGFANLISNVPSGGRYLMVGNLFMFVLIIWYLAMNPHGRLLKLLKLTSVPALLLFTLVAIRIGLDFVGTNTVFGNPLVAILGGGGTPLIEYVKLIF